MVVCWTWDLGLLEFGCARLLLLCLPRHVLFARLVRATVSSNQSGQFPKRLRSGNIYNMVNVVDINSNGILVKLVKSWQDAELTCAYWALMKRLQHTGIEAKKHVLDNEISEAMKSVIRDEYKTKYELVSLGCHWHNVAEVAIQNFKAHYLSILAGVANTQFLQFPRTPQ